MDEQGQEGLPLPGEVRTLYDLSGRVALVTGAASGLGRAMAWGFACFGADVAIVDRDAGVLSGGQKKKLGLACALIQRPKILFLDEPTNGVDPISRREFWDILSDLHIRGVTIFVSTASRASRLRWINICGGRTVIATSSAMRRAS
jgi:ABC-type branched-subunit amino acid transport system ATPase component